MSHLDWNHCPLPGGCMAYLAEFAQLNPNLIFVLDLSGKVVEHNPAAHHFAFGGKNNYGCDQSLLGMQVWDFATTDSGKAALKTFLLNGVNESAETHRSVLKTANEELRWYGMIRFMSPIRPLIYLEIADISKRIELEDTLEREKQKLAQTSKLAAVGEMAAGIAHEINNPMAVISMASDNLIRELETSAQENSRSNTHFTTSTQVERMKKQAERIHKQAERVTKIILGLKSISRHDISASKEPVCVGAIFDNVLSICGEKLKSASIEVKAPTERERALMVMCRQVQIEQVLLNLIHNSHDAILNLNEKWIEFHAQLTFGALEISVTDSGQGITREILKKIMNPFFTTKEVGKGTGLGLSISKSLIEDHGGRFFYDRASSHTRFVLQLPTKDGVRLTDLNVEHEIQSHSDWKQTLIEYRLRIEQEPGFYLDPEELAADSKCSLGMWLYGSEDLHGDLPSFQQLKDVHAAFHLYCAKVAREARSLDLATVKKRAGPGSTFQELSAEVIRLLRELEGDLSRTASSAIKTSVEVA